MTSPDLEDKPWRVVHVATESQSRFEDIVVPAGTGALVILWHQGYPIADQRKPPGKALDSSALCQWMTKAVADARPRTQTHEAPAKLRLSVVIPTRGRAEQLARCVKSFQHQSIAPDEIIVVDNAPTDASTHDVVSGMPHVRYIREPLPGLDFARNAGARAATGDIVAFCDDDLVLHERWCERMKAAFDQDPVMAVTGLVLPLELDTQAQRMFEFEWGFGRGYRRIDFDSSFFAKTRREACPVWNIGAGASMAFRRAAFDKIGLFDERLDAGAAGCSGDSEIWYRVLAAGWVCRYEPSIVSHHQHRRTMPEFRKQIRAYMRGHVASLFVQFQRTSDWGNLRRAFVTLPVFLLRRWTKKVLRPALHPEPVLYEEAAGSLSGLLFAVRNMSEQQYGRRVRALHGE